MATMAQIRKMLVQRQVEESHAWAAKYPFTTELQEKHYVWDHETDMEDIALPIEDWLIAHVGQEFSIRRRTLGFKDRDMAFAFRMRWG